LITCATGNWQYEFPDVYDMWTRVPDYYHVLIGPSKEYYVLKGD
jgi:hypothetical protein